MVRAKSWSSPRVRFRGSVLSRLSSTFKIMVWVRVRAWAKVWPSDRNRFMVKVRSMFRVKVRC
jgi:hypothetical protein